MLTLQRTGILPLAVLALAGGALHSGAQEVPTPEGRWEGAILVPEEALQIEVTLTEGEDGEWSGVIKIPEQGREEIALRQVMVAGTAVTFRMPGVPAEATFRGTLSDDGRTISGSYAQGPARFDFSLTRQRS